MLMEIAHMGHPVLLGRAKPVEDVFSKEMQEIVQALIDTHNDAGGVGLSAPQLYIPLRIFLIQITEEQKLKRGLRESFPKTVFINPEMEVVDERQVLDWERCLSVPSVMGEAPRFEKIRYRATSPEGKKISGILEGYTARVFQHEFDHLNGILYTMRIPDLRRFGYVEEMLRQA